MSKHKASKNFLGKSNAEDMADPPIDIADLETGQRASQAAVKRYAHIFDRLAQGNPEDAVLVLPVPRPGPSDWLTEHKEAGQTYATYVERRARHVDHSNEVIVLAVLGNCLVEAQLEKLKLYVSTYFALPVVCIELDIEAPIKANDIRSRINADTKKRQLWVKDYQVCSHRSGG